MKSIVLTRGFSALVDDEDFDLVSIHTWHANMNSGKPYAWTRLMPARKAVSMHRFLMKPPRTMVIDHVDGNSLNNSRSNLRVCTRQQNLMNRANTKGRGIPKGVYLDHGRYRAQICVAGKRTSLGNFKTPELASAAYQDAARRLFGEFARADVSHPSPKLRAR